MKKYLIALLFGVGTFFPNHSQAICHSFLPNFCCSDPNLNSFDPNDPRLYANLKGGFSGGYEVRCEEIFTKLGYYVGASAGYRVLKPLRIEGEFIYHESRIESVPEGTFRLKHLKGCVRMLSAILNGIIDFNCDYPVKPYMGVGLGYAQARGHWKGSLADINGNFYEIIDYRKGSIDKNGFAWQILAGLRYSIGSFLDVDLEYRFFKLENKISNHNLGLSLVKLF